MKKKPKRPRRFVRKIDEYVIDFACEDACVKVTNVKSVKKCSPEDEAGEGRSLLPTRTPACTYLKRWGRGRLIIVCAAPRPMAWRGNYYGFWTTLQLLFSHTDMLAERTSDWQAFIYICAGFPISSIADIACTLKTSNGVRTPCIRIAIMCSWSTFININTDIAILEKAWKAFALHTTASKSGQTEAFKTSEHIQTSSIRWAIVQTTCTFVHVSAQKPVTL